MTQPNLQIALLKLDMWVRSQAELVALEAALVQAMRDYSQTLGEPPRPLIIEAERKRQEVQRLFEIATEALDAHSTARTGHTDFGNLR